jgi:hypothetical protein
LVAEVQVVFIGDRQWMTNLLTGQWEKMPATWGLDPAAFFDSQAGIPHLIAHELIAPRLDGPLPVEELDGEYWHLSGETTGDHAAEMSGGLISEERVELEAWIDPTTDLIHLVHLLLPESDPEEPAEWLVEFSDFDEPLDIVSPK